MPSAKDFARVYSKTIKDDRAPTCQPFNRQLKPGDDPLHPPRGKAYARVTHQGRTMTLHKFIVTVLRGETIPPDHEIDHACGHPRCTNYDHLRIIPARLNNRRARTCTCKTKDQP